MDRGAWWATVHEVSESDMTEWLSTAHVERSLWLALHIPASHSWLVDSANVEPPTDTESQLQHFIKGLGHSGILILAGSRRGKREGGPRTNPTWILGEDCISL